MNKKIYHACQILILPYWKSQDKYFAGILLSLVIALNVGYVYLNVKMNQLSGAFYDSLQKLSISDFKTNIFKFLLCAMIFIITFLTKEYIQDFLSFQWRSWMTRKYVERWLLGLLSKLNLSTLYQDLNTHADWNAKLSLGEQQRLSIVRIILKKPKWLILDEPTASLDTENQKNAIYTLFKALPEAAILTISHSDLLIEFHDRVLSIGQKNSNAVMNYSLV